MPKCIICHEHEREATIPDRNDYPSRRKKLCSECHGDRLKHDLIDILEIEKKRNEQRSKRSEV